MITRVESYGETHLINAKATIAHPMADEVSIAIGDGAYARFPHSVELAFFIRVFQDLTNLESGAGAQFGHNSLFKYD